jgi:hypothetical protein
MDHEEIKTSFSRAPVIVTLNNGDVLTGLLRDNGDGTFSMDSGLGDLENQDYVKKFTAQEVESVKAL